MVPLGGVVQGGVIILFSKDFQTMLIPFFLKEKVSSEEGRSKRI